MTFFQIKMAKCSQLSRMLAFCKECFLAILYMDPRDCTWNNLTGGGGGSAYFLGLKFLIFLFLGVWKRLSYFSGPEHFLNCFFGCPTKRSWIDKPAHQIRSNLRTQKHWPATCKEECSQHHRDRRYSCGFLPWFSVMAAREPLGAFKKYISCKVKTARMEFQSWAKKKRHESLTDFQYWPLVFLCEILKSAIKFLKSPLKPQGYIALRQKSINQELVAISKVATLMGMIPLSLDNQYYN